MNSGTRWTRRHKAQLVIEPSAAPKPRHSRRVFIWTLSVILVIGGAVSAFWLASVSAEADQQTRQATSERERADQVYSLLTKRLSQEKAYQHYARQVAATVVATGQENFAGSPLLSKWAHNDPTQLNSIVNKQHPIYPLNFIPQIAEMTCGSGGTAELVLSAKDDFTALCNAAASAGVPLLVTSSYRSYADQIDIYLWWVTNRGEAAAERASALPGYSEHQLGLAVDFATPSGLSLENFGGSPQQQWLHENSWKYGFIQRYTEADQQISGYDVEAWHYRYIGRSMAETYIKSGATSLEQYWHVSGGSYDKAVYTTMPAEAK